MFVALWYQRTGPRVELILISVVGQFEMNSGDGDRMMPDGRHLTDFGSVTMVMTIVRLMLVIVGTAAYVGLAILGWGGLTAFFSHPALVALAVALTVMAGASVFAGGNLSPGLREDRGNRGVIVALALIGLLDAYLPAYTDRKAFWTLDGDPLRCLASCSSLPVVPCGYGQSLCSAVGSVGWSPYSPGTRWSPVVSMG
jgi:hypothetical protein